jgi:hypothetical protein
MSRGVRVFKRCSEKGDVPPLWVSEDQGLPIAHGGGIGLTMAFAIGRHTGVVPDGPQCG